MTEQCWVIWAFFYLGVVYHSWGGGLSYDYKKKERSSTTSSYLLIGVLLIVVCSIGYYLPQTSWMFWLLPTSTLIGLSGILIIIWCKHQSEKKPRLSRQTYIGLCQKAMLLFGTLSYGIYLWQGLFEKGIAAIMPQYQNNYGYFSLAYILVVLTTAAISFITYYIIEMPFKRLTTQSKKV